MSDTAERTLAVDLGDARIGLAVSDALGWTAQPLPNVASRVPGGAVRAVAEEARHHGARTVVVGLPLTLSGEEGDRAERARAFGRRLESELDGVEVVYWDERLTTVQAERDMIAAGVRRRRRRERVDAVAAVLILQSYLDARG